MISIIPVDFGGISALPLHLVSPDSNTLLAIPKVGTPIVVVATSTRLPMLTLGLNIAVTLYVPATSSLFNIVDWRLDTTIWFEQ